MFGSRVSAFPRSGGLVSSAEFDSMIGDNPDHAVRSRFVVVSTPSLVFSYRVIEAHEPMLVQAVFTPKQGIDPATAVPNPCLHDLLGLLLEVSDHTATQCRPVILIDTGQSDCIELEPSGTGGQTLTIPFPISKANARGALKSLRLPLIKKFFAIVVEVAYGSVLCRCASVDEETRVVERANR